MMIKSLFIGFISLLFVACASKQTQPIFPEPVEKPVSEKYEPAEVRIDYDRLQEHLGLKRNFDSLGYAEKSFDTCRVGYGYSSNKNCRKDYFVLIHFQLMCRDADESS